MKNLRGTLSSKDLWSGLIFFFFGVVFVYFGRNYQMGTAMRMGPAYFPTLLGALLTFVGIILMAKTFIKPGDKVESMRYSKVIYITLANLFFAFMLRRIGVVLSIVLLVLIGAYASQKFKWSYAMPLALGLAIGSAIIFVLLLHLPLPILGQWFGG
ncbi:MAG: tripartite tricarboxylate transporter TctB family protein [Syntrophorhabdaceae bacterium]|nr:tripartite tricarboxylate transporter TctB family protein [Syntrophorhabdaceae bacterium]